jgi:uncharacterized membrane protein
MRSFGLVATILLLLSACGGAEQAPRASNTGQEAAPAIAAGEPASVPAAAGNAGWDLQSSGEGTALVFTSASGATVMRLFCPARSGRLIVNVPGFRPVGSEERLSFGSGNDAVALVADSRGDSLRGGVSGEGPVPDALSALGRGSVSATYGAQRSGPHPAPPADLAAAFVLTCREGASPAGPAEPAPPAPSKISACLMQGKERLSVRPLRAVGTEPFWAARVEGRCVTYSHPEDQKGTRVWTRYTPGANGGGTWVGALGGRPFELRVRAAPGCSDGMSDKNYPLAVDLLVAGERRQGCAEPI